MADIFDRWDEQIDGEGMAKDIADAAAGGNGDYPDVPYGTYEVSVNKMELKASSKGDPMISIWFKIVSDGEYKGSMIFDNQVVTQGFQIHIVNDFLKSMATDMNIEFVSYTQYADLLLDVAAFCDTNNLEFAIKYEDNKGYDKFTITEVFEG